MLNDGFSPTVAAMFFTTSGLKVSAAGQSASFPSIKNKGLSVAGTPIKETPIRTSGIRMKMIAEADDGQSAP
ncbi:hypothetical protein ABLT32_00575 [Bacteroides pyogenes]|uniref:Uncharacterized protein n=3 Tax=Bacteroides pyogenes TaxID=310300 RepID=W4PIU6_9BACE|nr:hypothetical protein [Bacteroides pyogenes]GAE15169.1 hypothetical protein JCM6292_1409 [Bacteroides pyogenes JCM 6292]GAE19333.1 hypothetical protein JCM6294_2372 [Bacteroides pyogenes DSM 20611 = JCM 6294]